ncbi:Ig-like domain-containing protein [Nanoarchaeota archaeon]
MYFLFLIIIIPLSTSWTGPPPAEIVYYGYAYVNGSPVSAGTTIEILANGGALVMGNDTTILGGYFPGLQMIWDNPDTGTDEGITYGDNAENIYFKIAGQSTTNPQYLTATMSQAGQSIEINLSYLYNFPPVLDFISDQVFTEDVYKCFNITATDNNSFRNDTLTYSDNAPGSLVKLNNNLAQFCWTPSNGNVGNHTYTYTVTDDGTPQESDNQAINVEVINVNDAPYINLADKTTLVNETFVYDVSAVSGDIDPTSDTLNYTDNTTLFEVGLSSGLINFTPNVTGVYSIEITVTDNWGASTSDTFTLTVIEEEKVVIRRNVYYNHTNSVTYIVTNKIYNFLGTDITNARFVDEDIGFNDTINITNEKSITISGEITLSESGDPFLFNDSTLEVGSDVYRSNQPRIILPGATVVSTSGGGGGTIVRSDCPAWPACPECPEEGTCPSCPECPEPTQELITLPEIEEEEPTEVSGILPIGLILLIIILLILRWLYLRYSVKRNLKFIMQRKNNYHFLFKKQRFSAKLLNSQTMEALVYTKRKNKEFIEKTILKIPKSRWKYSFRAFFKIRSGPVKNELILKNMQRVIKEKSLKTLNRLNR